MIFERFKAADESIAAVCNYILPFTAITHGGDRRGDDAEVLGLPVGTNDELVTEIFELILVIALPWDRYPELSCAAPASA